MTIIDRDLEVERRPIPLTALTGFLGAGKTTLLNRILNGDHGLRVGVLVNDFGSVNIDAELVVGVESDVISLANGCVCCSIRDDLVEAIKQTIDRPEQPEYLLLEASGVAEPSGIALTFVDDSSMRERVRLDSITCVVDAEQVFAAPELMELKIWQIAFADLLILNKVDLVQREQIDRIRAWLDERMHRYRLVEATQCDVPLELLLGVGRFDPIAFDPDAAPLRDEICVDPSCDHDGHDHDHDHTFARWSYETHVPLSLEQLRKAASRLPANTYRAKGVVYAAEQPDRRVVLQVVGKRVDISLADEWGPRPRRTQVVAIGARDLDPHVLQNAFEGCQAGDLTGTSRR
jgi:G3E family GTPase